MKKGLNKDQTLVIITSALFVNQDGQQLAEPSQLRINRLQQTIDAFVAFGFKHFLLLDHTLLESFELNTYLTASTVTLIAPIISKSDVVLPKTEYKKNGPSKFEAILLYQALPQLRIILNDFKFILKISAGYQVKNLGKIISKASNGAVYRMGNPFRTKIKFCLSSFYILSVEHFIGLCSYFYSQLNSMSNLKPLEYHLYQYVQTLPHQLMTSAYPVLEAKFLSSGRSSNDIDYQIKEKIFKLLAKLGLYAYQFK